LIRYAASKIAEGSGDWCVFEAGYEIGGSVRVDGPAWISFRDTFFLTSKNFITRRPGGGVHILEHRQVDRRFFELFEYPDPGPLWDLIEVMKRRSETSRRFLGPTNLQNSVRRLTEEEMAEFGFSRDAETWQALVACRCDAEAFSCGYVGNFDGETLCDGPGEPQRAELECTACASKVLLFDATLNGYDVAIEEGPKVPGERSAASNRLQCSCGNSQFRVAVEAVYDADPETLREMSTRQRNESFGWIRAVMNCCTCRRRFSFVDYECA
jgi:hypothetical protein